MARSATPLSTLLPCGLWLMQPRIQDDAWRTAILPALASVGMGQRQLLGLVLHNMDMRSHYQTEYGQRILKFHRRLPPLHEHPIPQTLRLLERREQAQELQRVLGTQRAEFQITMEGLALQWEELCAKEAELRDYLLRFQHFIEENEVKCQQAVKKAKRAQEIYNQKEQTLCILQAEQQSLIRRKQKMKAQIQQYRKFCDYLENTVEASEEFQVLGDVLSRIHTLVATSRYLQRVVQEAQASIDQAKSQFSRIMEEKSDEVLQLDNQLGQLQANLEEAEKQRLLWDSHWAHIQNTATKKTLLIGTLKMATLNLFQSIAIPDRNAPMEDTMRQLDMVQEYIQDLSDIYEATRRQLTTNAKERA